MELNDDQKIAVQARTEKPVKVISGAGTGKTRVLVQKYLRFVLEDGILPDQLLALTFTNRAASEMRKRIFEEVKAGGDERLFRSLYDAWITNFHGFCYRLLKENAPSFSLDPDFGVATEVDLARLRRELFRNFEMGYITGMPEELLEVISSPGAMRAFFDTCMDIIIKSRSLLLPPEVLGKSAGSEEDPQCETRLGVITALWQVYEDWLGKRNLVDFTGMISLAVEALRTDERLRNRYVKRFVYILVDEFQDTSEAQNELLRVLSGGDFSRVTVVGDEKQSIYRWRDARVENLRSFPGGELILNVNYRSTQEILDLAHRFISLDPYFAKVTPPLAAERGKGGEPIIIFHPEGEKRKAFDEEAKALASWILLVAGQNGGDKGREGGVTQGAKDRLDFGDVAILMRSLKRSSGLPFYEEEFQRMGIPYAIVGAAGSVENSVLRSFRNLLSLILYPDDIEALVCLLEEEPFSLCDRDLYLLFQSARKKIRERALARGGGSGDLESELGAKLLLSPEVIADLKEDESKRRCEALRRALEDLGKKRSYLDFPNFIWEAVEVSHFFHLFFAGGGTKEGIQSVLKEVYRAVDELMRRSEATLSSFLEILRVLSDESTRGDVGDVNVLPGRVRVMTIHQAKGLEFRAVAVPGIRLYKSQGERFYLSRELGLRWGGAKSSSRGSGNEDARAVAEGRTQEERCLVYVAMTRAQDHLFLSSPFPEGAEKRGGKNLFSDIIECLRSGGIPYEEWRKAPRREKARGLGEGTPGPEELEEEREVQKALDVWISCREKRRSACEHKVLPVRALRAVDWRALRVFAACPLMYRYRYQADLEALFPLAGAALLPSGEGTDEDLPEVGSLAGIDPASFGTFIHTLLYETMLSRRARLEAPKPERLAERFGFRGRGMVAALERASCLLRAFDGSPLADATRIVWLERPFNVRLGRIVFNGVFDRLDRLPDGHKVIDYKVGHIREEYNFQVLFYAWALRRIYGSECIKGLLSFLGEEVETVEVDTSPGAIEALEKVAWRLESSIESGDFAATPGPHCTFCSYKEFCPHAE